MTLTNVLWLFTGQLIGLAGGFIIARHVFTEAGQKLAEKNDRQNEENARLRKAVEDAFALLRRHGILENHERN